MEGAKPMASAEARTIFDKIWDSHVVTEREDGESLIYIDRVLLQENSFHAFVPGGWIP